MREFLSTIIDRRWKSGLEEVCPVVNSVTDRALEKERKSEFNKKQFNKSAY